MRRGNFRKATFGAIGAGMAAALGLAAPAGAQAVPEPSSLLLSFLAGLGLFFFVRRR